MAANLNASVLVIEEWFMFIKFVNHWEIYIIKQKYIKNIILSA